LIINSNINEITTPENLKFYQNRLEILSNPILEYLTRFHVNEAPIKEKIINSIDFSTIFGNVT